MFYVEHFKGGYYMKIKFLRECKDKYNGQLYQIGQELVFPVERAKEILSTGYAIEIEEVSEPKKSRGRKKAIV